MNFESPQYEPVGGIESPEAIDEAMERDNVMAEIAEILNGQNITYLGAKIDPTNAVSIVNGIRGLKELGEQDGEDYLGLVNQDLLLRFEELTGQKI